MIKKILKYAFLLFYPQEIPLISLADERVHGEGATDDQDGHDKG